MLAAKRSTAELLASIEAQLKAAAADLAALKVSGGPETAQLTPTTSFWMTDGNGADVMRLISLGQTAAQGWTAHHEHWFRAPGFSYGAMGPGGSLKLKLHHRSAGDAPDSALEDEMSTLSKNWAFVMLAKGKLDVSADWSTSQPTVSGTTIHSYAGTAPEGYQLRVVFCIGSLGLLTNIVWVSDTKFETIFANAQPGASIVLTYDGTAIPDPFSPSYYFVAP